MILFVKLTKGIGHKFYQLMKSSPINTINSHLSTILVLDFGTVFLFFILFLKIEINYATNYSSLLLIIANCVNCTNSQKCRMF